MAETQPDLWQCPQCGERFVTVNIWHSCGQYELEPLFVRSEPQVRQLFDHFAELVRSIGPVTIIPQKTRIAFQVRVRFVSLYPRKSHLLVGFWFPHHKDHLRFHKIEQYSPRAIGHHLRLTSAADFDEQFMEWLRESYAVGEQAHLR